MKSLESPISVLLVDDSPSDLALAAAHIGQAKKEWNVITAETGRAALDRIAESMPDIIVTDLRMPEMDGMELIQAIQLNYPDLPAIIVTARGSEALAVEALDNGAASYVPKGQIPDRLVETIEQVLGRVQADSSYQDLIESIDRTEFHFTLKSDPLLIAPLVDLLQQMAYGMNIVDSTDRRRLGIALDEAILNAMYHGNLALPPDDLPAVRRQLREGAAPASMNQRSYEADYRNRRVQVSAVLVRDEARFTIRDDGDGFHPGGIPDAHDPKTLESEGGRGLVLMANFMDELTFNDMGNEVTMVKRLAEV